MTITDVQILDEAVTDLEAGFAFYEDREEGIGDYFTASLLADLRSLRLYAGVHSRQWGYLRMLASRFPFAIYYEITGGLARVIAVLDMRQDPGAIQDTLKYRSRH
jgi:hypothetical protein